MSSAPDFVDIDKIAEELDREESRIVVRLEMRKFRKPTTVIEGLPKASLEEISRKLKHALATGGTAKEGMILLQGDQREGAKNELLRQGFTAASIEMQ